MSFDFDEVPIAPPLSLSAPELGAEPPTIDLLKLSASSTELLHERAMIRFYEQAAAEEAELQKLKEKQQSGERKQSIIPKIQINSKDEENIIGLETKHSLRRRLSAGGTMPQQILWAQRRHSLRNSSDLQDIRENKLYKFPLPLDSKKIKELKDEEIRERVGIKEENLYDEVEGTDYEEISEDEYDDRKYKTYKDETPERQYDEEDVTYHPRMVTKKNDEPFEILTKPNKLPDPNFVPKPILKKREAEEPEFKDIRLDPGYISRERSQSLVSGSEITNVFQSYKISGDASPTARKRSYSLIPTADDTDEVPERRGIGIAAGLGQTVAAIATISGLTAAGVIIPNTLLNKKKDEEEAKVVIDHYGDIVNQYNQRKRSSPSITPLENKKVVNNIFSVRQTQKQQSIDDDPYKKFVDTATNLQEAVVSSIEEKIQPTFDEVLTKEQPSKRSLENLRSKEENKENQNMQHFRESMRRTESKSPTRRSSSSIPVHQENWSKLRTSSPAPTRVKMRKASPSPIPFRRNSSKTPSPATTPSQSNKSLFSPPPSKMNQLSSKSRSSSLSRSTSKSPSPTKSTSTSKSSSPLKTYLNRPPMMREIMTQTSNAIDPYKSISIQTTLHQELLSASAEVTVKNSVEYLTDLVLFFAACYLYLFSNELLVIPILIVMVYRQLKDAIKKRMPKWMMRKSKEHDQ